MTHMHHENSGQMLPAQSIDDFYTAFDIKPDDGMWLDPEKRVHIW
jgi:putative endopeptidase